MLKQKFILTYGIEFISLIIGIASGIIVARIGGPNVVGTLAFGMAFVAVFQFVTDLGIGTAQQKLVTSTDDIRDYISTFTVLKFGEALSMPKTILKNSILGLAPQAWQSERVASTSESSPKVVMPNSIFLCQIFNQFT